MTGEELRGWRRIEEDIPKRTLNKRRIAEDQQGDADDNHQNGSSVTTAGNGGKHEGEVPEKKGSGTSAEPTSQEG